jgi:hypothetical protein
MTWRRIPFAVILTIVWAMAKFFFAQTTSEAMIGSGLIVLSFVVVALEFYKSGDINLTSFIIDHVAALAAIAVCSNIVHSLYTIGGFAIFTLADAIVLGVITIDAVISPINAFRTAQRNWAAGHVGSSPGDTH